MQHPMTKFLHKLLDELPFLGKKVGFINVSPISLIQGERFLFVDEIVVPSIPGDLFELRVVSEPKLHSAQDQYQLFDRFIVAFIAIRSLVFHRG